MELLVIFLQDEERINALLSIFVELDIDRVSQIQSEGLMEALASGLPIFAGLRDLVEQRRGPSHTILALIESEEVFDRLSRLCVEMEIDFENPEVGTMFAVPVARRFDGSRD